MCRSHRWSIPTGDWCSALVLTLLVATSCGSTVETIPLQPLAGRAVGTVLVMGCVIVEPATDGTSLEVILGFQDTERPGAPQRIICTRTDAQGYFLLPNLPKGRYAVRGVRAGTPEEPFLLWNDMTEADNPWLRRDADRLPSLKRGIWPWDPREGVFDLGYLVFQVRPREGAEGWQVTFQNHPALSDATFLSGHTYTRPPLPRYFLEKYPESEWAPVLRRLAGRE
jgi:hypothetical protein